MSKVVYLTKNKKRSKVFDIPKHFTIDVYLSETNGIEASYEVDVSNNLLDTLEGRKLVADVMWSYLVESWEGDPAKAAELISLIEDWAAGAE